MNRMLLPVYALGLLALSACDLHLSTPTSLSSELARCQYVACKAILQSEVIVKKPVIVLIPTDYSLQNALVPKGLDLKSFLASPESRVFAQRHVLDGVFIKSGSYTDLAGYSHVVACDSDTINSCKIDGRAMSVDYNANPPGSVSDGLVVSISEPLAF